MPTQGPYGCIEKILIESGMDTCHPLRHPQRPFLVYLTDNINVVGDMASDTSKTLWDGLTREAVAQNCDILAVICGNAHHPFPSRVHQLISPNSGDGFVCWISRMSDECEAYFSRFENSPLISMSQKHGQHPVVAVNNGSGIRSLLLHLTRDHGCRKIAFVRGPLQHPYAEERFSAYQAALAEAGLDFDPDLVSPPGPWRRQTGEEAIGIFLDERGLIAGDDFDAIMCASDRIATGCIAQLQQRHIHVPDQVAVTGFNFLLEARSAYPSLSTVAMPFEQKARLAVQWVNAALQHNAKVPLPLEPIVMPGESCGCLNHQTVPAPDGVAFATTPDWSHSQAELQCLFPLFRHASAQSPALRDSLVDALSQSLERGDGGDFVDWVRKHIDSNQYDFMDIQIWNSVFATLRQHVYDFCTNNTQLRSAEQAIQQAGLWINDQFTRQEMRKRLQEQQRAGELRLLNADLVYCGDMASIAQVLVTQLPQIGVASAWVVLFDTSDPTPENARLLIAMEHGKRYDLPESGLCFPAMQLLPEGYCHPRGRRNLLLHPLSDGETEFGYALFEVGLGDGAVYESLAYSVGTAVKSVLLRDSLRQHAQDLEQSLQNLTKAQNRLVEAEKMAALGGLVAGIAHEINTPVGISVTAVSSIADTARAMQQAMQDRDAQALRSGIAMVSEGAELAGRNLARAADLIDSFKKISVDQASLKIRSFALGPYIEDVIKSHASWFRKGQYHIRVDCPSDLEIKCDPGVVAQIFTNLIQNSLIYGFDQRLQGLIQIRCQRQGNGLSVVFADDGAGMNPEVVDKIFLPFFTTRRGSGGSGLGMHIVYNLVTQNLAGTIVCHSAPDQGARFEMQWQV